MRKEVVFRGSPLLSLLTVLFVGLKLTGVITWSWWWVLAPIWIPLAILLVLVIIAAIIVAVSEK